MAKKQPIRRIDQPFTLRRKLLIAGFIFAFLVEAIGWPASIGLARRSVLAQRACADRIFDMTGRTINTPQDAATSDPDAARARMAALESAPCRDAVAAARTAVRANDWLTPVAIVVLMLSFVPELQHWIRSRKAKRPGHR